MTLIDEYMELWPHPFGMSEAPQWAMPWVAPGPIAQSALANLGTPLHACQTGTYFDPEELDELDWYEDESDKPKLTADERAIRDAGPRLEWRLERVWALDEESSKEEREAYEKSAKSVAGRHINPRCLDDYASLAWNFAEMVGLDSEYKDRRLDSERKNSPELREAFDWAQAGVVVLQQSLPWPFTGVLPWSVNDNRPAHRVMYAYARLLNARSPRQAKRWFRAMLFANPMDNMGVRDFLLSGSR